MGLFSKKKKEKNSTEQDAVEETKTTAGASEVAETAAGESSVKKMSESSSKDSADGGVKHPKELPSGPLDLSQISDDKLAEYTDFGAFLVPKIAGLAIYPESPLDEKSFGSLTMQFGKAAVELLAVAAPKSQKLWDDLRKEVRGDTTKQGNTCEERQGSFGEELLVQLAVQASNGQRGHVQMRYCGVDGPNWFVRLVFNGAVAADDSDLQMLEKAVKSLVVVRGSRPMTPRSIIPVVLPDELTQQLAQIQQEQQA